MKGRIFNICRNAIRDTAAVLVIIDFSRITTLWEEPKPLSKHLDTQYKEDMPTLGSSYAPSGLDDI